MLEVLAQGEEEMPRPTLHDVLERLKLSVDPGEVSYVLTSKELTRDAFFQEAHWAVLVSTRGNDTANEWCRKAQECGFPFDWRSLAAWTDAEFKSWCKRMAQVLVMPKDDLTGRFRKRWWAIYDLGCYLAEFESEAAFREHCFGGKKQGHQLRNEDYHTLFAVKKEGRFSEIGDANIWFIMRNLGGNFLKPDKWIKTFASWYGKSVPELARELRDADIHCGEFDAYCWKYCESQVHEARRLPAHFDRLFG